MKYFCEYVKCNAFWQDYDDEWICGVIRKELSKMEKDYCPCVEDYEQEMLEWKNSS